MIGDIAEQNHEFVAAQARDDIVLARAFAQAFGNLDQQLVARGMAERIVDDLETVEIDEQHRAFARLRSAIGNLLLQQPREVLAVGQAG